MSEMFPLDPVSSDDFDVERYVADKHARVENTVIKRVCKEFGIPTAPFYVNSSADVYTGRNTYMLSMDLFLEYYPTFPVVIVGRSIPYLHEITFVDLFKRFTKLKLFKELDECAAVRGADLREDPLAVVFPWTGLGHMALHNHNTSDAQLNARFIKTLKFANSIEQHFVLEPFVDLLATIAQKWTP